VLLVGGHECITTVTPLQLVLPAGGWLGGWVGIVCCAWRCGSVRLPQKCWNSGGSSWLVVPAGVQRTWRHFN